MKFFKSILEIHNPKNSVETIEIENDDGSDVGNYSVFLFSYDIGDRDSDREYHEERVDVDDYRVTNEYSEMQDGLVSKITVYVDSLKHRAFYIDFDTNFRASKYFDCSNEGYGGFDVSELRSYNIRDVDQELSSDETEYVVQLARSHLHKVMSGYFRQTLCVSGVEDMDDSSERFDNDGL